MNTIKGYKTYIETLKDEMFKALADALSAETLMDQVETSSELWARSEALRDAEEGLTRELKRQRDAIPILYYETF